MRGMRGMNNRVVCYMCGCPLKASSKRYKKFRADSKTEVGETVCKACAAECLKRMEVGDTLIMAREV